MQTEEAPEKQYNVSIHALREEGDASVIFIITPRTGFYPRPPRGGRPRHIIQHTAHRARFYPRPPRGGRRRTLPQTLAESCFYPRPPRGGRLFASPTLTSLIPFLSTPSARRATEAYCYIDATEGVSIHALREEGDARHEQGFCAPVHVSIHALREEGDSDLTGFPRSNVLFLSTPSARRATVDEGKGNAIVEMFLSTPSARRATYAASP